MLPLIYGYYIILEVKNKTKNKEQTKIKQTKPHTVSWSKVLNYRLVDKYDYNHDTHS